MGRNRGRGRAPRKGEPPARAGASPPRSPARQEPDEPALLGLQRLAGNRAVASRFGPGGPTLPTVQRDPPTVQDRRVVVDETIDFFEGAARFYTAKAETTAADARLGRPPPTPDATLAEIARILPGWKVAYDSARQTITDHLGNDPALGTRLRSGYEQALAALRRPAKDAPRVNVIMVAAPGRDDDQFLRNAADYARTYFTTPPTGDTVTVVERVGSLDELFAAVESAQPERMVRRIDIFAHGTIQPSNQLKLAGRWHSAAQIETALDARRLTSNYLQSTSRVDDRSTIEFHGCRLGGGEGEQFLGAAGRALGGAHGQEVVGYRERWFPRRFQVNWRGHQVVDTARDVYGDQALPIRHGRGRREQRIANRDRFVRDFEAYAIRMFDQVIHGSQEVRSFLRPQELSAAADAIARDRKLEVMRAIYDRNGAWLLGFLHPAHEAPDRDPPAAVSRDDYTFTREHDAWEHRTVRVRLTP